MKHLLTLNASCLLVAPAFAAEAPPPTPPFRAPWECGNLSPELK